MSNATSLELARVGDSIECDVRQPSPRTIRMRLDTAQAAAHANDLLMDPKSGWRLSGNAAAAPAPTAWERRQGMRVLDGWRWHKWESCTEAEAQRVTGLHSWQVRQTGDCPTCDGAGRVPCGPASAAADGFNGDTAGLIRSINALLDLDAAGAMAGPRLGGHARTLLTAAANRLAAADHEEAERYRWLRVRGAAFHGDPQRALEQGLVYRIGNLDAAVDAGRRAQEDQRG